jgi:hypothetical protein
MISRTTLALQIFASRATIYTALIDSPVTLLSPLPPKKRVYVCLRILDVCHTDTHPTTVYTGRYSKSVRRFWCLVTFLMIILSSHSTGPLVRMSFPWYLVELTFSTARPALRSHHQLGIIWRHLRPDLYESRLFS